MGRKRIHRPDLPRHVTFTHGAYYFRVYGQKAINLGRDFGEAMRKYGDLVQTKAENKTIGDLMNAYLREWLPKLKPRTQEDYLDAIRRLRPVFGKMRPEDLRKRDVYAYLSLRKAKVRANREVAVLSNVMELGVRYGQIDENPCKGVERNPESPRTREVLPEEVAGFMAHTPAWLDAYIVLKSLTGLRQGDMLRLTTFAIRDDGLFVETGKRGKRLLFQWTPALRMAVEEAKSGRRKPSESRLFPITGRGFKSAWSRAMAKYTGERFAENDLRAKVASEAVDLGLDAASMLGHSSDSVTRRHYVRGTRKVTPLR